MEKIVKKHRHRISLKIFLTAMVIFFTIAGVFAFYAFWGIYAENSASSERKHIIIEQGESSEEISKKLQEEGLIRSRWLFDLYVLFQNLDDRLQAGEYDIPLNANIQDVVKLLTSPQLRAQRKITIIEGWRLKDIQQYFEKEGIASSEAFEEAVSQIDVFRKKFSVLEDLPEGHSLEGYLFPDTYLIYQDASVQDVIEKILSNTERKFSDDIRQEIRRQGKTIHEILTLASIIEREVQSDVDKKIVAGIFYKRLKIGMPLQADSTINYITERNATQVSLEETKIDHPYNTYRYAGLPPGPISQPGMSSILAALYPEESPYVYFLTTPEGQVIYSQTFDEHRRAKSHYLQ